MLALCGHAAPWLANSIFLIVGAYTVCKGIACFVLKWEAQELLVQGARLEEDRQKAGGICPGESCLPAPGFLLTCRTGVARGEGRVAR